MAREKKNATIAWLERSNPLRGLSIAQANSIFDAARNGDTQRLHWMYQEIETQNPVLSMAVTRRSGAAASFAWRVSERAAADGALSAEQKDAAERFFADIDNLSDLFEHLDLALFRGFAHAQPIWEDERTVRHIELLDSWKFLRKDGEWLFNPVCDGFSSNCVDCRDARLVTVERRRPVDVPALSIHLRAAVGARDWGRFIERYALPKPAVVMAQNATKADRDDYLESASALENGQVTVWPSGASLMDFAGSSRGVDPFTAFIQHQEKTILMLATGGTLGSMAESGAGTLAGNAQQDVWEQIVGRDAGVIAQAVGRSLLRPFLAAAFPGRPVAVDFDFDLTKQPTPKEIFETATAAKSAGYIIVQEELEEATGYTLEKDPGGGGNGPLPGVPGGGFALNKREDGKTALQTNEKPLQNAPSDSDGQGDPKAEDALVEALSGLFEKSLAEAAADAISGGRAESLELGAKSSGHPSLQSRQSLPSRNSLANSTDAQGNKHDDGNGKFTEKGGGGGDAKDSPTKPAADKADATGDSGSSGASVEAANDGKIDFKGNTRAKAKADEQSRKLGYRNIDDLMQQSTTVAKERIDAIVAGGDQPCKPHEAIAALRSHATIQPNVKGEEAVKLTERPIRHYVCGERRHRGGEPDVSRLESLPMAIKAIRESDSFHHEMNGERLVRMPGEQLPKGTQTIYERRSGQGKSKAFAYTDSGVLNGWQLN